MAEIEISVRGMRCGGCERALQLVLGELDGVHAATADRRARRVRVRFDPQRVDEQQLRAQIEQTGFRPLRTPTG